MTEMPDFEGTGSAAWEPDVAIVGGGPAGLSAALVLARAGRRVAVIDSGKPRNAPSAGAHNVFTRDGTAPEELRAIGRRQAGAYGARFLNHAVEHVETGPKGLTLRLADGSVVAARKLLLATGVEDVLPDLPGFREAWGRTVVHCPYCHGHELRGLPTAILGSGNEAAELARLVTGWTDDVTLLTDGGEVDDDILGGELADHGVRVRTEPVAGLEVADDALEAVRLTSGERLPIQALYHRPPHRPRGSLVKRLGLALTEAGLVEVDAMGRTNVPGIHAAGDVVTPMQMIASAVASGTIAAAVLNHELVVGRAPPTDREPPSE